MKFKYCRIQGKELAANTRTRKGILYHRSDTSGGRGIDPARNGGGIIKCEEWMRAFSGI